MAKVIGFDPKLKKQFTCYNCGAIVEHAPNEAKPQYSNGHIRTDEGKHIYGLNCPNCGTFHRTNP